MSRYFGRDYQANCNNYGAGNKSSGYDDGRYFNIANHLFRGLGFCPCAFCHSVSRRCISSFETVKALLTALLNRSASVSPEMSGAGFGFMALS